MAQVSIGIGIAVPGLSIGINLPAYPSLALVPGYPVYYAPRLSANYFFYDGLYWVFQGDHWYASSWYNGPWGRVRPEMVPVYVLRVPVRCYRQPPPHFRGWRPDAPPRWDEHWGGDWAQRRGGWDKWDRKSVPAPAPLPTYQRQYSGDRYPQQFEQQQPAAQLLVHRVVPVAHGDLCHLRNQRLRKAQQDAQHRSRAYEFLLQQVARDAVAGGGAVHHGAAGRRAGAHDQRHADHTLVADHVVTGADRHRDLATVRRVRAGVVEQVGQDLIQPRRVGVDLDRLRRPLPLQAQLTPVQGQALQGDGGIDGCRQVDPAPRQHQAARVAALGLDQVADQARHARHAPFDGLLHARQQRLLAGRLPQHRAGDAHRRLRVAQLGRHRAHEGRLPLPGPIGHRAQLLRVQRGQHQLLVGLAQIGQPPFDADRRNGADGGGRGRRQ